MVGEGLRQEERVAKRVRHMDVCVAQKLVGVLVSACPPFLPPSPYPPHPFPSPWPPFPPLCLQLLQPPRHICGASGSAAPFLPALPPTPSFPSLLFACSYRNLLNLPPSPRFPHPQTSILFACSYGAISTCLWCWWECCPFFSSPTLPHRPLPPSLLFPAVTGTSSICLWC